MTEETQIEWARRAAAGETAAFDALTNHWRPVLRALAFGRTGGDWTAADELAQDVLTRAWEQLPTLREPSAFVGWLKTILANACHSWHRRTLRQADVLERQADPRPTPLESLLAREHQRELRCALAALPDANRNALLMHVWGGASYAEIAAFTGVRITTVEGRIYRAKRQMRRLLPEIAPQRDDSRIPERKPTMTTTKTTDAEPLGLLQFTGRFTALVDSGVSLVRSLDALTDLAPPYGEAAAALRRQIEEGRVLSQSMERQPELFSPFYIALVRAGEVGGVLDETLRRAADAMRKEWKLVQGRPPSEPPLFLLLPSAAPRPADWSALTPYQRAMTLSLFCETLATLLQSGVPILRTMTTVAALLPERQQPDWLAARETVKAGDPLLPDLEAMGIFPRFTLELFKMGEEAGSLHITLHRAAEWLAQELEWRA